MALTAKQQAFVDAYKGNATEAARIAGYKGNDMTLGQVGFENMKKPEIVAAIQARQSKRTHNRIATREDRQNFWTAVMRNDDVEWHNRLRAAELLGKSEADFTEKHQHAGISIAVVNPYTKKPEEP